MQAQSTEFKTCETCGERFFKAPGYDWQWERRRYCSPACAGRRREPLEPSRVACEYCGNLYLAKVNIQQARFCSKRCRQRFYSDSRTPDIATRRLLPAGTVGAIGEMEAAVDLTRRGYHVFRAIDPACPCDLIAMHGAQLWRIEVRTGHYDSTGIPRCQTHGDHDIIACVIQGNVHYNPDLPNLLFAVASDQEVG